MMVSVPSELIDRPDLNLLQRALMVLIIRHCVGWGAQSQGVGARLLADHLSTPIDQTVAALDALVEKSLLQTKRVREGINTAILYSVHPELIERVNNPSIAAPAVLEQGARERSDATYYLNLSADQSEALEAFALSQLAQNNLSSEIFDDFHLFQRSQNHRSFDWHAEFIRWMMREKNRRAKTAPAPMLEEYRATQPQFELTQYFIAKLAAIDPQFEAPFDVMSWAVEIKLLNERQNYALIEIKTAIDWLFSAKGDWFRPNVQNATELRKHFKRIIAHTRSYRDGVAKLPEGVSIFDLLKKE